MSTRHGHTTMSGPASPHRRDFLQLALGTALAGTMADVSAQAPTQAPRTPHTWHLRYAPELDWLPEVSFDDKLELFAAHGFTLVEYNWLMRLPLAEVEQMRKPLDRHQIPLASFVGTPDGQGAKRPQITDRKEHEAELAMFKTAIEYAKVAGNTHIVTQPGAYWGGSRSDQRRNVVDSYKRVAELLAPTGLIAVVEPTSTTAPRPNPPPHPAAFFRTSEELVEVLSVVNSPNIRMLFDLYHLQVNEGNLIAHMQQYWDYIAYVQTGDVPGRGEPGTGEVNYRNILKMMSDKGFSGPVGMEHRLTTPGREGLLKCFEAYRNVDSR
jgi:hydroxypyruvate isomerase